MNDQLFILIVFVLAVLAFRGLARRGRLHTEHGLMAQTINSGTRDPKSFLKMLQTQHTLVKVIVLAVLLIIVILCLNLQSK